MLQLTVIESSAEGRNTIVKQVGKYLSTEIPGLSMIPRVSINPLSIEEAKYNPEPIVCLIGENIAFENPSAIRDLKLVWPNVSIVVQVKDYIKNISILESLARMGIDDTISVDISPAEFLGKLLILSQKKKSQKNGKLIMVDSGKGGLGVTSFVSGLGEAIAREGKKVLMIDLDYETQDLSRFLQARPYINESLSQLFSVTKPITKESVEECFAQIWYDNDLLYSLPPCPINTAMHNNSAQSAKTLISVLEVLDSLFDFIIVDPGCAQTSILNTLYRLSDEVFFIVNNDPASLYPSVSKFRKIKTLLSLSVNPKIINNGSKSTGLSKSLLHAEFNRASGASEDLWLKTELPFCAKSSRWPGSKVSMYSLGSKKIKKGFSAVLEYLEITKEQNNKFIIRLKEKVASRRELAKPLLVLPNESSIIATNTLSTKNSKAQKPTLTLPEPNESELISDTKDVWFENLENKTTSYGQDLDLLISEPQSM